MYKFTGEKFNRDLDVKEIAKLIRKELKGISGLKTSVRIERYSMGRSINVSIKECGFNPMNPERIKAEKENPHVSIDLSIYTKQGSDLKDKIQSIVDQYNFDDSDSMTDYFNVNFYGFVNYDWQVEKVWREEIESNLDKAVADYLQAIEDARPLCVECGNKVDRDESYPGELCWDCYYPIMKAEKEEETKKYQIIEAEREKAVSFNPLSVVGADYFIDLRFPSLNKNDHINDYIEQLNNNEYRVSKCKVEEVATITNEDYKAFTTHLMSDYSWLKGKGGTNTTADIEGDFFSLSEEDQETWRNNAYNLVILVTDGKNKVYIDPQGYGYARYAAFEIPKNNVIQFPGKAIQ